MHKKILQLAIPSIIANVTTPLLGLVDTAIVGHMGSAVYIAAIAVGSVMFNMLYWLFGFLRGGTSGLCAQAYGAQKYFECRQVLKQSVIVAVTVGLIMVTLQLPILDLLCSIMQPDKITLPLVRKYFGIVVFGAPAMLVTYALTGWFLGMQNSKYIMWVSLTVNITNIAASCFLVYGVKMGIAGVAAGTLIAQWCGLLMCILFTCKVLSNYANKIVKINGGRLKWKRFFSVNSNMMLRTICMIAVTVWFTRAGALQGPVILAVNSLLIQLFLLFSYIMDGFAFAGEALSGRFTGAGQTKEMRKCVIDLFKWGTGMALAFTVAYFLLGESFLSLLTDDSGVRIASREYLVWAISVPFAGFAAFVWDGVYIGATMMKELVLTTFLATIVFFTLLFLLQTTMGNHALWLAFISYLFARGAFQTWLYAKK